MVQPMKFLIMKFSPLPILTILDTNKEVSLQSKVLSSE